MPPEVGVPRTGSRGARIVDDAGAREAPIRGPPLLLASFEEKPLLLRRSGACEPEPQALRQLGDLRRGEHLADDAIPVE